MAEWIRRLITDQEIPGSSPGRSLNLSLAKRALYRLSYTPFHVQHTFLLSLRKRLRTFLHQSLLRMCTALRMRTAQGTLSHMSELNPSSTYISSDDLFLE